MSNSGKVWNIREAYKKQRGNEWSLGSGKGFFMGGGTPSQIADITTINLNTTGNASDFGGDLLASQGGAGKGSNAGSPTRIVYGGGATTPAAPANEASVQISYFVPTSSGSAAYFGDLTNRRSSLMSLSSNTRAVFGGGYDYAGAPAPSGTNKDIIDFITIQSLGNATDFGDLQQTKQNGATCGSSVRGLFVAGHSPGGTLNQVDYITIASTGNASDFGDLAAISESFSGSGDNIRGIVGGGNQGPYAGMDFFTIATTGNSTNFGDLTQARRDLGSTSNQIRQTFAGGADPNLTNIIDFITIANLGNASDFGDLTAANRGLSGSSDSHNGLELGFFPRESVTYMPGSGRGLVQGVGTPYNANVNFIDIPTLGNSVEFGDLTQARTYSAGVSSVTRAVAGGGSSPGLDNRIDAVEMASRGNYFDFGNLSVTRSRAAGFGSTTRGCFAGGDTPSKSNVIDYITIASAGDATDFGDLTEARTDKPGGLSSSTRGVVAGGATGSDNEADVIDYVTIASTGNATDFGNLSIGRAYFNGISSSTRGVFSSGLSTPSSPYGGAVIDYVTISSTGNATDFGDPTQNRYGPAGMSNSIRGVFAGGRLAPNNYNVIDYITIASTGNAADFGDLSNTGECLNGVSDSHGGLQA